MSGVARRKCTSTRSSPASHAQSDEVDEPAGDVEWLGQLLQPVQLAYWPAAHWLHDCPLSHAPTSPTYPAGHVQADKLVLPAGDTEFVGHVVHSPLLCEVLYFPASHALQGPPLLVWPGLLGGRV